MVDRCLRLVAQYYQVETVQVGLLFDHSCSAKLSSNLIISFECVSLLPYSNIQIFGSKSLSDLTKKAESYYVCDSLIFEKHLYYIYWKYMYYKLCNVFLGCVGKLKLLFRTTLQRIFNAKPYHTTYDNDFIWWFFTYGTYERMRSIPRMIPFISMTTLKDGEKKNKYNKFTPKQNVMKFSWCRGKETLWMVGKYHDLSFQWISF